MSTPDGPGSRSSGHLPEALAEGEGELDLSIRLLSRQIEGPDKELVGKVDDLLLSRTDDGFEVTHLMVGIDSLARRFPGRLGRWTFAIWRRLRTDEHPGPTMDSFDLEKWLRRQVISRLPGSGVDPGAASGEPRADDAASSTSGNGDRRLVEGDAETLHANLLLSALIGASVRDAEGVELGILKEIGARVTHHRDGRVAAYRSTSLVYGPRHLGSKLGYGRQAQGGPILLARLLERIHRHDRRIPTSAVHDVDVSGRNRRVTLRWAGTR